MKIGTLTLGSERTSAGRRDGAANRYVTLDPDGRGLSPTIAYRCNDNPHRESPQQLQQSAICQEIGDTTGRD